MHKILKNTYSYLLAEMYLLIFSLRGEKKNCRVRQQNLVLFDVVTYAYLLTQNFELNFNFSCS